MAKRRSNNQSAVPTPQIHEQNSLTRSERLSLAGVALVTLLTYASTFTFGWAYDDPPQIPQNPTLQWSRLGFLLTHHLWATLAGTEGRFYRPLLALWFLVNKTLFGLNPHWFHVTTVLAHVAATILAFFIARRLLNDAGAALFAAAIFGLHPLQAESASWISAVNDPLAAVLCFGSFLAFRKTRDEPHRSNRWWAISAVLFALALLMKEVSVVLPGIILLDLWSNPDRQPERAPAQRSLITTLSIYASIGVLWLILRSWVLGHAVLVSSSVAWSSSFFTAPKILLFDFYRAIVPVGLSSQYDVRIVNAPGDPQFFPCLLILLALVSLAAFAAKRNPQLWSAYAWIIFPLLPTLNLRWMNQGDFVHDRYLYMSMLGVALLAGLAYADIRKKWPELSLARPLAAALVVALAFAAAIQSQYWANDVVLFSRSVSIAPQNEWAQLNYGSALSARGKFAEAAPYFVRSYELDPGWRAADFAGFAFQQSGNLPEAEHWFNLALQLDPALANAYFGLAQIRLGQHHPDDAIVLLNHALEIQPDAEGYHYALGTALEQVSRSADAIAAYETELQMHPGQTGAQKAIDRLRNRNENRN